MKHIQLFEDFTKNYGEKISQEEFENIAPGTEVVYMGKPFKVEQNNKATLSLKAEDGHSVSVNYNMFNEKGAITTKTTD